MVQLLRNDVIIPMCRNMHEQSLNMQTLTLWRPLGFEDFRKKSLNARGFAQEFLRPGKSLKKRGKSSSMHSNKNFLLGECGFFVSDVISGGLLSHLDPLCLALGANR